MKHTIFILTLLACGILAMGQSNRHLKFQGLPIDGPLIEFQQKLLDKGFQPSDEYNKSSEATDNRMFTGIFSGLPADVYVYFTPNTQVVYLVTAVVKTSSEEQMLSLYQQLKQSLTTTYSKAFVEEDKYEGYDACTYYIRRFSKDTEMVWKRCYGSIGLACYKTEASYNVFLDFTDQINGDSHEKASK